jgi:hypothetical protein
MARIRSIHPKLLTDEAFMALTLDCPLAIPLLVGLWMEADDSGTFEWKLLTLKARILPAPNVDIAELLDALCRGEFIKRFEIGDKSFGVIRNFVKYQRPKSPLDTLPFTKETRAYAGFVEGKRPRSETGRHPTGDTSEPLPNPDGTGSVIPPQREEGGGREGKKGSEADASAAGGPASPLPDPPSPPPDQPAPPAGQPQVLVKPTYLDAKHELWGEGRRMLVELGIAQSRCGALIGGWCKECGDDYAGVLDAIARAREFKPIDPIPWIVQALPKPERKPNGKSKSVHDAARELTREVAAMFGGRPTSEVRLIGGGKVG